MAQKENFSKSRSLHSKGNECSTCLYVNVDDAAGRENCLRFARFVDHALHDSSKGCDYWTPIEGSRQ